MAAKPRIIQELITGSFMVAVLAVLLFFTIVISNAEWLHSVKHDTLTVAFDHVGALKDEDPVMVRGYRIGSVKSMRLKADCIEVALAVPKDLTLREDYIITVGSTSVLGGSKIDIDIGTKGAVIPHETLLRGTPPHDIMADLGKVAHDLRQAISGDALSETITDIRTLTHNLAIISTRLEKGEGTLGKLLSDDDTPYQELQTTLTNFRQISDRLVTGQGLLGQMLDPADTTYADIQAIVTNLKALSADLQAGKGLLGQLLKEDDTTYDDLRASMANIRSITAKLDDPKSGLGRLLTSDTTLITDLETTAANLRDVTAKLNAGQGTFGRWINDETMAIEVEAAVKDVRQIIDNLRDTAPITTFSSLFFSGM